jgi:hypothetical protein
MQVSRRHASAYNAVSRVGLLLRERCLAEFER